MDIYIRKALRLQGLTAHWRSDRERGDHSNWFICSWLWYTEGSLSFLISSDSLNLLLIREVDRKHPNVFRLKGREERERMLGVGDDYDNLFGDDEQEYIDSKFTNQQIQVPDNISSLNSVSL